MGESCEPARPERDDETLCLACGFCCDGSFFDVVRLTPPEVARMTALGLPLIVSKGGEFAALPQPCAALEGTRCRVYTDRPGRCAEYRCHLLEALAAGEVARDEALAVVAEAKSLADDERREDFLDRHFRGRTPAIRR